MRTRKSLFIAFLICFCFQAKAQIDAFTTSSYLYNNYYLAPPLAERSKWFIPESFVQLSGFLGHTAPNYPMRNFSIVGNYSTKPDWGYTYRPIKTWSGWGMVFAKNWHSHFRETTYAPSYYFTYRTKMRNYDKRFDPPAKLSAFIQPQLVRYKTRKKHNAQLENKNCYNLRIGAVYYKDKYYVGIQANRIFKNTQEYYTALNDSIPQTISYLPFYTVFGSYRIKVKKTYLFRPSAVVYYQDGNFYFDANIEREFHIADLLPFEVHLFAVAGYSHFNETITAAIGARRVAFERLDVFYKFQKNFFGSGKGQKALHELAIMLRLGHTDMNRPDFVERD